MHVSVVDFEIPFISVQASQSSCNSLVQQPDRALQKSDRCSGYSFCPLTPVLAPQGPFTIGLHFVFVDLPGSGFMLDAGVGENSAIPIFTSACFVHNMRLAGIYQNVVDALFITEANLDHVEGPTDRFNGRVFKRVYFFIRRSDTQFMLTEKKQTRPFPFASNVISKYSLL